MVATAGVGFDPSNAQCMGVDELPIENPQSQTLAAHFGSVDVQRVVLENQSGANPTHDLNATVALRPRFMKFQVQTTPQDTDFHFGVVGRAGQTGQFPRCQHTPKQS
jgi:hypothetical protein